MDVHVLRLVISSLTAICGMCIFGIVLSNALGHDVPPTLGAIASMAAGSLVGILVTPAGVAATKAAQQKNASDDASPPSHGGR